MEATFSDLQSELLFQEPYRVVKIRSERNRMDAGVSIHPSELPAQHEIFEAFDIRLQNWHDYWWKPSQAKIRVNMASTAEMYYDSDDDWSIVPEAVAQQMEKIGFYSYKLEASPPLHKVFVTSRKQNINPIVTDFIYEAKHFFNI